MYVHVSVLREINAYIPLVVLERMNRVSSILCAAFLERQRESPHGEHCTESSWCSFWSYEGGFSSGIRSNNSRSHLRA